MPDSLLEDLADRVRPYVRQCPTDTISQALLDVIRDFCNFTRAYQVEDSDTVQALVSDYDLQLPSANVELISIESMIVDKLPSYPKTPDWLTRYVAADWRTRSADDFRYHTVLSPGVFSFACVPTRMGTPNGIQYRLSLRPIQTATVIDTTLANEWIDVWSDGALWKLKSMGGVPPPAWYDPVGAKEKRAEYMSGRGQARIRINNAYGAGVDQRFINRRGFA